MKLKLTVIAAAAMAAGAFTLSLPVQADPVCEEERTVAAGSIYTGTKKQEEYCADLKIETTEEN